MKTPPQRRKVVVGLMRVRWGNWGLVFRRGFHHEPWLLRLAVWIPENPHWHRTIHEYGGFRVPPRPVAPSPGEGGGKAAKPTGQMAKFPHLADYLLSTRYDGSDDVRLPGYLIIRPSGGVWNVVLKDPTTGLQLRVATESLDLAWGALDALLAQPSCPWEIDAWAKPGRKRK